MIKITPYFNNFVISTSCVTVSKFCVYLKPLLFTFWWEFTQKLMKQRIDFLTLTQIKVVPIFFIFSINNFKFIVCLICIYYTCLSTMRHKNKNVTPCCKIFDWSTKHEHHIWYMFVGYNFVIQKYLSSNKLKKLWGNPEFNLKLDKSLQKYVCVCILDIKYLLLFMGRNLHWDLYVWYIFYFILYFIWNNPKISYNLIFSEYVFFSNWYKCTSAKF